MLSLLHTGKRKKAEGRRADDRLTDFTGVGKDAPATGPRARTVQPDQFLEGFGRGKSSSNSRFETRSADWPGETPGELSNPVERPDAAPWMRNMSRWWGFSPSSRIPEADSSEIPDSSRLNFYCNLSEPLLRLFAICRSELIRRNLEHVLAIRQRVEAELETVEKRQEASHLVQMHAARHRAPHNPENLLILELLGIAPECDPCRPPAFASESAESLCLPHPLPGRTPIPETVPPGLPERNCSDAEPPTEPHVEIPVPAPRPADRIAPGESPAIAGPHFSSSTRAPSRPRTEAATRTGTAPIRGLDQLKAARKRQEGLKAQCPPRPHA